jgi:DNA helicase-2/ATP-dependent DNA helicase PcrA
MQRFDLSADQRHRALDDVVVLVKIIKVLQSLKMQMGQLTSLEMFLDIVALGIYLENTISGSEDRLFFLAGGRKILTAYSKILKDYSSEFNQDQDTISDRIRDKLYQVNPRLVAYHNNEHIIEKMKQLAEQYQAMDFDEAVASFLSYLSLNNAQDQLEGINAVSLLTYHAAKGLEFDKVILMGMENKNMPGFHALKQDEDDDRPISKKLEEQRRLFYVGMTRAKSELVLTAVKNRGGWEHESSPFLKDLKIQ